MTAPTMTAVEVDGIRGQQLAHHGGNSAFSAFVKDVEVIGHQGEGEHLNLGGNDQFAEPFQEPAAIVVIAKNLGSVDSPDHDVVQGTGNV